MAAELYSVRILRPCIAGSDHRLPGDIVEGLSTGDRNVLVYHGKAEEIDGDAPPPAKKAAKKTAKKKAAK